MEISSNIELSFRYGVGDKALEREIRRNVNTILLTPIGSCPLYRDFGLDVSMLDKPIDVAENLYAVAVMDAIERWEPRVQVQEVKIEKNIDGQMRTKVVVDYVE